MNRILGYHTGDYYLSFAVDAIAIRLVLIDIQFTLWQSFSDLHISIM